MYLTDPLHSRSADAEDGMCSGKRQPRRGTRSGPFVSTFNAPERGGLPLA